MSKSLGIPPKRALPSKESTLFKELLSLYETRQLKKGQKTADRILTKFPEHGETLCMKGLVLTHLGKREEGLELVKQGIRLDLTSHICWHVFGLLQKGEKKYDEALKSYTQALRFDKENLNILRDAAQLQTQLRLYDRLVETRYTLLKLRPAVRQHWIALAVAYHLNGNLLQARKMLEQYARMLKNVPDNDVEHSESVLYHVRLLEEIGDHNEALSILDTNATSKKIVDRTAVMEFRARLLTTLHSDAAEDAWKALINLNSDCYDYYRGYLSNRGVEFTGSEALAVLLEFSTQIPRATAPRRLSLTIATGSEFVDLVKPYLISGFTRGIPSLFADLKALYKDPSKQQVIEDIVEEARTEYSNELTHASPTVEPTTYLWTLYFLAQHHSFLGRHTRALALLEEAIQHTPTLPELQTCKARVLKRAGDYLGAARCLDEARSLDGQDRFLNTKCGKYLLRADLIEEASSVFGLFTKKDAGSPGADLEDMQSLLYLLEEAGAHYRSGKLHLALKKYTAVHRIFHDVEDDQFDFHGYSLRKFTINVYLDLLKWEDRLRSHPAYIAAALRAAQIYIEVYDDPSKVAAVKATPQPTEAEKKAQSKARKAARRAKEEEKVFNQRISNEDKGLEAGPAKDDDPDGLKLLSVTDPLERANALVGPLMTLAPENVDVWIVVFDLAIRRKKLLQALKALNQARKLVPDHPEVHIRTVDLVQTAKSLPQEPPAPLGPIFVETTKSLLPEGVELETFNSQYLQRHSKSAAHVFAVAKVAQKLGASREDVEGLVFLTIGEEVGGGDVKTSLASFEFLNSPSIASPRAEEYRIACDAKFEHSTVFKSPIELVELRSKVFVASMPVEDGGSSKQGEEAA